MFMLISCGIWVRHS